MRYTAHCISRQGPGALNQDNACLNGRYREDVAVPAFDAGSRGAGGVYAVFDGMGGEQYGEVASRLAAACVAQWTPEILAQAAPARPAIMQRAALYMNELIVAEAQKRKASNMGCTLALLCLDETEAQVYSLGDSRIYRWRGGELLLLTHDHTLAQQRADFHLTDEYTPTARENATLTQYLGMPTDEVQPELHMWQGPVRPGDIYLVCSDGLTHAAGDDALARVMRRHHGPRQLAERLAALATPGGGPKDDVTIIAVACRPGGAAPARPGDGDRLA